MRKKKGQTGRSGAEVGFRSISVATFIILLAFLIVLNSLGAVDEKATLTALGSLTGSFGILPGGLSTSQEGEVRVISGEHVPMDAREAESVEISSLGGPGRGVVDIRKTPHGSVLSVPDRFLFDEGSHRIRTSAYGFLKKLCEIINQGDYPVEITGHTDDVPAGENWASSNQELSSLRALEVFKFFAVVGNVAPTRLVAFGCGEHKPIASNETRQTRARNRRIDIALAKDASDPLKGICGKTPSALVVFKRFVFRVFD